MITFILFTIVIFWAWYKPPVAIAILLQINIVRSLAKLDFDSSCFYCPMESDPILGAALPILSFIVIFLKIGIKNKKITYHFDKFDVLMGLMIFSMIIGTIFSFSFTDSVDYSSKFLILAVPYFFIVKLYFLNFRDQIERDLLLFFKATLVLAMFFSLFAIIIVLITNNEYWRLTMPGVHPIPYSQLIGLGVLMTLVLVFNKGKQFLYLKNVSNSTMLVLFAILLIIQFATNTRGVLLALIISVILLLKQNRFKLKRVHAYVGLVIGVVVLFIGLSKLDVSYLFRRVTNISTDQSILDRIKVYFESFGIFAETNFIGTGPGAFKYYSFLEYPHNMFLENLAVFGIMGIIINLYFIMVLIWIFINRKKWRSEILLNTAIVLFVFFFVETMFSFTLWMHKGMYITMALVSVTHYRYKYREGVQGDSLAINPNDRTE